jgi:predicted Zn-dependent peptidase
MILDTMGPHDNASTDREDVRFFKKVSASFALQALDVLFEMAAYPLFRDDDVEIEKGPVIEELKTHLSSPYSVGNNLLTYALYGDQSAGRDIGGTVQNVQGILPEDVRAHHRKICVGSNILVILAGKVEERLLEAVREKFGEIPCGISPVRTKTDDLLAGPASQFMYRPVKQMFLSFAVKTVDYFHEDVLPLQVFATALGGMTSSLLFEEVRVERGFVYHIHAGNDFYSDRGYLEINCEVSPHNFEEVVSLVLRLLSGSYAIHEKYIDRAQNNMIAGFDLGFEDSLAVAHLFADRMAFNLPFLTMKKIKERIALVSHDDVRDVASRIFEPQRLYVAGVGPVKSERRIERIREVVERAFK